MQANGQVVWVLGDAGPNAGLLKRMLEDVLGVRVVLAEGFEQAMRLGQQGQPTLVLLDTVAGPTELDVLRGLKTDPSTRAVPVMAMTYAGDNRVEALEAGADQCFSMPWEAGVLLAELRARLEGSKPAVAA